MIQALTPGLGRARRTLRWVPDQDLQEYFCQDDSTDEPHMVGPHMVGPTR